MGKITIAQAAKQLGTSQETILRWIEQGLLEVKHAPPVLQLGKTEESGHVFHCLPLERYVDESDLHRVAEAEGWLMLSAETWNKDDDEG
ncbi:MAG: hypothetical protein NZL85_08495 [Fimbriimonadales bacterium]|nr:hypothetical protein [Fimbriimonadales bacterium]